MAAVMRIDSDVKNHFHINNTKCMTHIGAATGNQRIFQFILLVENAYVSILEGFIAVSYLYISRTEATSTMLLMMFDWSTKSD